MVSKILTKHYPSSWVTGLSQISFKPECYYKEIDLAPAEYFAQQRRFLYDLNFVAPIRRITRVENPFLYGCFLLKQAEYESRGIQPFIFEMYHDTGEQNVSSILSTNLDWRVVTRDKFGKGVSFSPDPCYANRTSNDLGHKRVIIIADVLIGNKNAEYVHFRSGAKLPCYPYDTTIGNNGKVYVKYYDNEFYPKNVVYYDI